MVFCGINANNCSDYRFGWRSAGGSSADNPAVFFQEYEHACMYVRICVRRVQFVRVIVPGNPDPRSPKPDLPGKPAPGLVTGELYPNNFSGYSKPGSPNPEHRAPDARYPKHRPRKQAAGGRKPRPAKRSRYSAASPLQSVIGVCSDSVGFSAGVTSIMRFLARSINSCSCSTI